MTIYEEHTINDLYDLNNICWSGALQRIDEAIENNLEDEFFQYIKDCFEWDDKIDLTQVNDFIWFECDEWLEEHKQENEED